MTGGRRPNAASFILIASAPSVIRRLPRKNYRRAIVFLAIACATLVAAANFWVLSRARPTIFTDLAGLPINDVGLVLGTSRYNSDGISENPFFRGRMNTAAQLYHAGKVRHLLLSGDNGHDGYDEPAWMRDALVARGVPLDAITLDDAGFRTLDSMARARAVFGLQRFTIITDDFHLARSVFLARSLGLDVVGYPSEHVRFWLSKKVRTRELASRTVACLDVYVFHTRPRFYGPPIKIDIADVHASP
jgi:SanA protein